MPNEYSRKRSAQRAQARAGRTCLVCGEPIIAQRSTRKYCKDACRAAAYRDSGVPRKKDGLLPSQLCMLQVLDECLGCLSGRQIAERTGLGRGHFPDTIGRTDRQKQQQAEDKSSIMSLLTLEYVQEIFVEVGGLTERCFEITAAGRKAREC